MERDEAIRRAEIAMAWARGEKTQFRSGSKQNQWTDCGTPESGYCPNFFDEYYQHRLKPKPLEAWIWIDNAFERGAFGTRDTTVICRSSATPEDLRANGRWVRMVEKQ